MAEPESITFGIMRKRIQYNMHWSTHWLLLSRVNITFIHHEFDAAMHTNQERIINVDNIMTKWKRTFNPIWYEKSHSIQRDFPHLPRQKRSSSGAVSDTLFTVPFFRLFHLSLFSPFFRVSLPFLSPFFPHCESMKFPYDWFACALYCHINQKFFVALYHRRVHVI